MVVLLLLVTVSLLHQGQSRPDDMPQEQEECILRDPSTGTSYCKNVRQLPVNNLPSSLKGMLENVLMAEGFQNKDRNQQEAVERGAPKRSGGYRRVPDLLQLFNSFIMNENERENYDLHHNNLAYSLFFGKKPYVILLRSNGSNGKKCDD